MNGFLPPFYCALPLFLLYPTTFFIVPHHFLGTTQKVVGHRKKTIGAPRQNFLGTPPLFIPCRRPYTFKIIRPITKPIQNLNIWWIVNIQAYVSYSFIRICRPFIRFIVSLKDINDNYSIVELLISLVMPWSDCREIFENNNLVHAVSLVTSGCKEKEPSSIAFVWPIWRVNPKK